MDPKIERVIRESHGSELEAWLRERCDEINGGVDDLLRLHCDTPPPGQEHRFAPAPFTDAPPVEPAPLRPGILDRLFAGHRRRREAAQTVALAEFREQLRRWETARDAHRIEQERQRRRFEEQRLSSTEIMHALLEEALCAIHWPRETLVSFELGEEGRLLHVDVDLPEIEDMPTHTAEVAARGLKLNIRELSPVQVRKTYLAHIHAILFRVIGVAFATLPVVRTVECSGFSQRLDPATGRERNDYLLSARVESGPWAQIDFASLDQVDPVASLERFELRRDDGAAGILRPITPFEVCADAG